MPVKFNDIPQRWKMLAAMRIVTWEKMLCGISVV